MHAETSSDVPDRVYMLFFAGGNATGAADALIVVADDCGSGVVDGKNVVLALESILVHAVAQGEFLQFAVVVSLAGKAFFLMLGEEKFQSHFAALAALLGVGSHFHALRDGVNARRDQTARARSFYKAHTAGADAVYVFQIAECGNFDVSKSCRFQDRRSFGNGDGNIVDFQIDIFRHCRLPHFLSIAWNLQFARHAPHLIHFALSIAMEGSLCPAAT